MRFGAHTPALKNAKNLSVDQQKSREGELILKSCGQSDLLILLDEKGTEHSLYKVQNVQVMGQKELLKAEEEITNWYIKFIDDRRTVEKKILGLEPLVRDIFISISDLTEGLQDEVSLSLTKQDFLINKNDTYKLKTLKFWYKVKFAILLLYFSIT